jgi:predicted transcriptional regulator of viral defense system
LRALPTRFAAAFLTDLAARGRYHFTTTELREALGVSLVAARASLRRLKRRGVIADPHRGFHVIVPPEYRRLGCLPAEQFVPHLMEHLHERYYVALLSAAELHGAAHQRPQAFQVMIATHRRPILCGQVRVQFVARRDLAGTPVVEKHSPRGRMRVASSEATALELVGYADQAGGLDHVATVLGDLAEALDASRLVAAARRSPIAWVQRLGYLLERIDRNELVDALEAHVREHATVVTPLVRARSMTRAPRAARWRIAINASIDPDPCSIPGSTGTSIAPARS